MLVHPEQEAELGRIVHGRLPRNILLILEAYEAGHTEVVKGRLIGAEPLGAVQLDGQRDCRVVVADNGMERAPLAVVALTFKI